jgi:hypothetical protein
MADFPEYERLKFPDEPPPWATEFTTRLPESLDPNKPTLSYSFINARPVNDDPFFGMPVKFVGTTCRRMKGHWWWPFRWPFGKEWEITYHFQFTGESKPCAPSSLPSS